MATKHDLILEYIKSLLVGSRVSIRSIAEELNVSEGIVYCAIKDAENVGLVPTTWRVGTIRTECKSKKHIERLTFGEVVRAIGGDVLGGVAGLDRVLNKFVIGAMTKHAIEYYITPGSLMIVSNRAEVQKLALEDGAAILIIEGFNTTTEITRLADDLGISILHTSHDTFTVVTMINRALSDQLIKEDIMPVSGIYVPAEGTHCLQQTDTISDCQRLSEEAQHSRFPVINRRHRLAEAVAAKDVLGRSLNQTIDRVMTKGPISVRKAMSTAPVSHQMTWDGLEVMPVVSDNLTLKGLTTRRGVIKTMQLVQRQLQITDTISDQISGSIHTIDTDRGGNRLGNPKFKLVVVPQMINGVGTVSFGVPSEIISDVAQKTMVTNQERDILIEQVNPHYLRLIQLRSELDIRPRVSEIGRCSAKLDIEMFIENTVASKAIAICQVIERSQKIGVK